MSLDLDAIKARCEAGINGPYYGGEYIYTYDSSPFGGVVCMGCGTPIESEECREHCAEADVLALVAEVERLRERLTVTDEMVERAVIASEGRWPHPLVMPEHRRGMRAAIEAALGVAMTDPIIEEEDCTCGGRCWTCRDAVGFDPEIVCPDCPIHGHRQEAREKGEGR